MSEQFTTVDVSAYSHQEYEPSALKLNDHYIIRDENDYVLDVFPITVNRLVTWRLARTRYLFLFNEEKQVVRLFGRVYKEGSEHQKG